MLKKGETNGLRRDKYIKHFEIASINAPKNQTVKAVYREKYTASKVRKDETGWEITVFTVRNCEIQKSINLPRAL